MKAPITYERKVRYSDTDEQGHVFNVNYFVYFDDAITDYMEAVMDGQTHAEVGYEIVLAHAECDFKSSAKLGEVLDTSARVERVGNTSITFALTVKERSSSRLVCSGKEVCVTMAPDLSKPIPVPESLRKAIMVLESD